MTKRLLLLTTLLLLASGLSAQEDEYEPNTDRFSYRIGGQFFTDFSSTT